MQQNETCRLHYQRLVWNREVDRLKIRFFNARHYELFIGECDCGAGLWWLDYGYDAGFVLEHFSLPGFNFRSTMKEARGE